MTSSGITSPPLRLRVGELVEVRSEREILATLDENGTVDGMPFMPEMLAFCGRRFPVYKRADKTCDTIEQSGSRRLYHTVHLEGTRCTGQAHGRCQALCLLFWKEAWLRRVDPTENSGDALRLMQTAENGRPSRCDVQRLHELTCSQDDLPDTEIRYRCQATELLKASFPLPWWDARQYWRDVQCGNAKPKDLLRALLFFCFRKIVETGIAYRALIWSYNKLQGWRGRTPYPFRQGTRNTAPVVDLDLQRGEWVAVKSHSEILDTLTKRNRNRGLWFDAEMVPYCGGVHRVLARVTRIIDERSGKMINLSNACVILEDVVCRARYSDRRFLCPRSIYPFWRENWLKRVAPPLETRNAETSSDARRNAS